MGCIATKHTYYKDEKTGIEYLADKAFEKYHIKGKGRITHPDGTILEGYFDGFCGVMMKGTITYPGKTEEKVELTSYSYCKNGAFHYGSFIGEVGDYTGNFIRWRGGGIPKYGLVKVNHAVKNDKMYYHFKNEDKPLPLKHIRKLCDDICEEMNFLKIRDDNGKVKYQLRKEAETIGWGGSRGFTHGKREVNYTDWGWKVLNTMITWMNQPEK